jgi:hypothetical protein
MTERDRKIIKAAMNWSMAEVLLRAGMKDSEKPLEVHNELMLGELEARQELFRVIMVEN